MSLKYGISALALAAALVSAPPAFAQLGISIGGDRGINVGVDLDTDDGLGVGTDVSVGGDDGLNVGADVGVGGRDDDDDGNRGGLIDADVGVGIGRSSDRDEDDDGDGGSGLGIGVGVGVGRNNDDGSRNLVDLDVNAGSNGSLVNIDGNNGQTGGGNGSGGASSGNLVNANVNIGGPVLGGSNLLGLGDSARGGALVDLIGSGSVGDADLDEVVDDRRVIIVDIGDSFSDTALVDIDAALGSGNSGGTDETRSAISASVKLSSVLANNGLSAEDVLAIQVGSQGETHVYIQPRLDDGIGVVADVDLLGVETADADVNLLGENDIADAEIDLFPGSGDDDTSLVDVDANIGTGENGNGSSGLDIDAGVDLGDQTVADLDAEALGDSAADIDLDILPGNGTGGGSGIDVDGLIGIGDTDLAQADIDILGEDSLISGDLVILPGSGDGDDDDDTPGGGGDDDGDTPGGGDDDGDTPGGGDNDDGDTPGGGDNGGDTPGNGDDDGNGDNDGNDGTGDGGAGGTTPGAGVTPSGDMTDTAMVSTMQCPTDIRAFLEATTDAASVQSATEVEIVILTACPPGGLFETADFSPLRTLLWSLPLTQEAIASADVGIEDVVSATVSGSTVTIYAIQ